MFEWYAGGHSTRWIAGELNKRGIPSPRGKTWAMSAIVGDPERDTGILCISLYQGFFVWNRTQWVKDPDSGKRKLVHRPHEDWVITPVPALRNVPEDLWEAVQARRNAQKAKSEIIRRSLHSRARRGAGPKYLF